MRQLSSARAAPTIHFPFHYILVPQVNEAPAYISRIASSMALARAVKQADMPQEASKPDWK